MSDAGNQLDVLRAALKASGDVAYDWDLVADAIEWLDGAHLGFGFAPVEPVRTGEAYHSRINPEDLTCRLEALSGIYQGIERYECEYRVRHNSGEHHWYHDRGVAEYDSAGKPVRLRGILRQMRVTELRESVSHRHILEPTHDRREGVDIALLRPCHDGSQLFHSHSRSVRRPSMIKTLIVAEISRGKVSNCHSSGAFADDSMDTSYQHLKPPPRPTTQHLPGWTAQNPGPTTNLCPSVFICGSALPAE